MSEEENREQTLRLLVDLAIADDPSSCFDGRRALRLLRSQSSREELEKMGIDSESIRQIWPEEGND